MVHRPRALRAGVLLALAALITGASGVLASSPGTDVRLTNDAPGTSGYVSADVLAGVSSYTDATLRECSTSRGRENEPALAIDPRNPSVMVGSSNDYCAVYNGGVDANRAPIASGPIWLGYYRSVNGGATFQSSLVPGYPGDASQLGALAKIRTASSGDPVVAWDAEGRLFMGSESSDDPAGTLKGFGDSWVARYVNPEGSTGAPASDGLLFAGSTVVAKGASAPNYNGKFNDKTAIEADRTDTACRGNVYFSWSRFNGSGRNAIYISRSIDHGATFSQPTKLSESDHDVQFPDISVTSDGTVYVTYRQYGAAQQPDAVEIVKSTDCGATFSKPRTLQTFSPMGLIDVTVGGGSARDCGDGSLACTSGYTFFRGDTQVRSTTDQADRTHQWVYILYDAIVPNSQVPTGTSFGWADKPGAGGQSAIYFLRYDGATGALAGAPQQIAPVNKGQQIFPDLAVDAGTIHALWWDSRNDAMNDASSFRQRPIGNDANGNVGAGFDVYAATRLISGGSWSSVTRLTDVTSNGQYEQFSGRTIPFGGDYLWIDSKGGTTFGVWTDWRNTAAGPDQREVTADESGADVHQCRTQLSSGSWTGDTCPRAGGLDQDIYGDLAP